MQRVHGIHLRVTAWRKISISMYACSAAQRSAGGTFFTQILIGKMYSMKDRGYLIVKQSARRGWVCDLAA